MAVTAEGPFAIFRLMKHHAPVVTPMEAHHERMKESYKSNKQIDPERTHLNYHVIEPLGRYRQIANRQVREAGCRTRKDNVLTMEALITASPEFMKERTEEELRRFFELGVEFMKTKQDPATFISAVVHMDEASPHMHLTFVPLTPDKRLSAKEIAGNSKKMVWWQDEFWAYMVKEFPTLQRGESAKSTRRKYIPTQLFKQATRLNTLMAEVCDLIRQMNPLNKKTLMPIIEHKLSKLFGGAASFQMELKKILRENKSLKKEVGGLEQQLAANTKSVLEELEKKQRLLELEEKERLLSNIPQEVIDRYNDHPGQQELSVNKE